MTILEMIIVGGFAAGMLVFGTGLILASRKCKFCGYAGPKSVDDQYDIDSILEEKQAK